MSVSYHSVNSASVGKSIFKSVKNNKYRSKRQRAEYAKLVQEKIMATQDYLINHLKVSVIENLEEYVDDMEGLSGLTTESYLVTKSATTVDRGTGAAIYGAITTHGNHYDINDSYESEETER